jgi:hypothetical protein
MDLNRHAADDGVGDVRGIEDTHQCRERGLLRRFHFASQPVPLLVEEETRCQATAPPPILRLTRRRTRSASPEVRARA